MKDLREKRGLILFCLIAAILLAAAILAFQATGPQGIEERFHSAAGLSPEEHGGDAGHEEAGGAKMAIEGNPLLYAILVCCLILGCAALYYHYRI